LGTYGQALAPPGKTRPISSRNSWDVSESNELGPLRTVIESGTNGKCASLKAESETNMAKRRGNPNWGKPEPIGPVVPTITEFEQVVKEFKLQPDQYIRSTRLREWARKNKNSKYIPEPLLEAWGFEIESTL